MSNRALTGRNEKRPFRDENILPKRKVSRPTRTPKKDSEPEREYVQTPFSLNPWPVIWSLSDWRKSAVLIAKKPQSEKRTRRKSA